MMATDHRPLIAHVMYRFDTGGLENGIVNLINIFQPEVFCVGGGPAISSSKSSRRGIVAG